ncbi:MAG: site-specific integrase [Clostridiaceae bacterium]|nr:site-specific integrase [Clostridiaceae bacterium]
MKKQERKFRFEARLRWHTERASLNYAGKETRQNVKTVERGMKQSARASEKAVKTSAKGSIKTAEQGVKTAEQTSRTAVKTAQTTAQTINRTAQASAKTAQRAAQAAKMTAKAATATVKTAAKAVAATVKALIAAVRSIIAAMRTLPLVPQFREKLLAVKQQQEENQKLCGNSYCKDYKGYVCVNEMGDLTKPSYITDTFQKVLKKNDLRKIRFHDLGHSCASMLLRNNVPMKQIQEWLRHSDFSTTANIYAHLDYSSKISSAEALLAGVHLDGLM